MSMSMKINRMDHVRTKPQLRYAGSLEFCRYFSEKLWERDGQTPGTGCVAAVLFLNFLTPDRSI